MRRILVCTGVLGGGTALVFALAALTAITFPQGTRVAAGWNGANGGPWVKNAWGGGVAVPIPAPAIDLAPQVIVGRTDGVAIPDGSFQPLPGDIVVSGPPSGIEVEPSP